MEDIRSRVSNCTGNCPNTTTHFDGSARYI